MSVCTDIENTVEVYDDEVDEFDAVLLGFIEMLMRIAAAEEAAMDLGVQGFHAAFHDLGEARVLADVRHRQASVTEHLRSAARGEQLVAVVLDERLREGEQASLVADGEEGNRHGEREGVGCGGRVVKEAGGEAWEWMGDRVRFQITEYRVRIKGV